MKLETKIKRVLNKIAEYNVKLSELRKECGENGHDGWYPLNPVDGLDIRAKREKVKHRNKVISIRYKG